MVTTALLALLLAAPARTAAPTPPPQPPQVPGAPIPPAPIERKRLGEWPARPSGKTVTLDEHMSVDDALEKIAAAAGWNLIANTGRLGDHTLIVTMRNAPVEEALDAVLEGSPLVATRRGNSVTVAPGLPGPQPEIPVLSGFDKPTGKRFTGDFTDTPVDQALRKVADAAGLSVVFPSGVRGFVNGHFKEAPVEDVLRVVLSQAGLVASREGSILNVAREGGRSLVIRGGKRNFAFNVEVPSADVGRQIEQSMREAERAQRDAERHQREMDRAEADAERGDEGKGGRHRRGGDRVLRGDQVIGPGERARDVVVLGGNVRLDPGATAQQVTAIMGSVDLGPGASTDGEVVAIGGDIHVAPGARVGGDAVSIGGKIVIDESGEVEGQQTSIDVPGLGGLLTIAGARPWHSVRHSPLLSIASALTQFAVFFGLGLLLMVVFPRRLDALTGSLVNAPLKAALTGLLGTLALPVAALLLVVTVVGIPLIAVLVLAVALAGVMGYTALALFFGRALPFRFERGAPIIQLAIGTAILVAIGRIPILGFLSWMAAWLFVFGAVLRTRFGQPPTAPPPPVYGTTVPPPMPPPATGTAAS